MGLGPVPGFNHAHERGEGPQVWDPLGGPAQPYKAPAYHPAAVPFGQSHWSLPHKHGACRSSQPHAEAPAARVRQGVSGGVLQPPPRPAPEGETEGRTPLKARRPSEPRDNPQGPALRDPGVNFDAKARRHGWALSHLKGPAPGRLRSVARSAVRREGSKRGARRPPSVPRHASGRTRVISKPPSSRQERPGCLSRHGSRCVPALKNTLVCTLAASLRTAGVRCHSRRVSSALGALQSLLTGRSNGPRETSQTAGNSGVDPPSDRSDRGEISHLEKHGASGRPSVDGQPMFGTGDPRRPIRTVSRSLKLLLRSGPLSLFPKAARVGRDPKRGAGERRTGETTLAARPGRPPKSPY